MKRSFLRRMGLACIIYSCLTILTAASAGTFPDTGFIQYDVNGDGIIDGGDLQVIQTNIGVWVPDRLQLASDVNASGNVCMADYDLVNHNLGTSTSIEVIDIVITILIGEDVVREYSLLEDSGPIWVYENGAIVVETICSGSTPPKNFEIRWVVANGEPSPGVEIADLANPEQFTRDAMNSLFTLKQSMQGASVVNDGKLVMETYRSDDPNQANLMQGGPTIEFIRKPKRTYWISSRSCYSDVLIGFNSIPVTAADADSYTWSSGNVLTHLTYSGENLLSIFYEAEDIFDEAESVIPWLSVDLHSIDYDYRDLRIWPAMFETGTLLRGSYDNGALTFELHNGEYVFEFIFCDTHKYNRIPTSLTFAASCEGIDDLRIEFSDREEQYSVVYSNLDVGKSAKILLGNIVPTHGMNEVSSQGFSRMRVSYTDPQKPVTWSLLQMERSFESTIFALEMSRRMFIDSEILDRGTFLKGSALGSMAVLEKVGERLIWEFEFAEGDAYGKIPSLMEVTVEEATDEVSVEFSNLNRTHVVRYENLEVVQGSQYIKLYSLNPLNQAHTNESDFARIEVSVPSSVGEWYTINTELIFVDSFLDDVFVIELFPHGATFLNEAQVIATPLTQQDVDELTAIIASLQDALVNKEFEEVLGTLEFALSEIAGAACLDKAMTLFKFYVMLEMGAQDPAFGMLPFVPNDVSFQVLGNGKVVKAVYAGREATLMSEPVMFQTNAGQEEVQLHMSLFLAKLANGGVPEWRVVLLE